MRLWESFDAAAERYRAMQKEKSKWGPLFAIFALLCIGAALIKEAMVKGADYLGGKATVEKFFRANLVRFVIMCVLIIAFIVVFIKTWNGRQSSIEQLVFSFGTGILVIFFAATSLMPVLRIRGELKHPRTAELSSYTLCKDKSGKYYAAFDDNGEGILLEIPQDKYSELCAGNYSDTGSGFAYNQISEAKDKYTDVSFYRSNAKIVYYDRSVIYKSAELVSTG